VICTAQLILGCERTHMAIEENCLDGCSQFTLPPGGHAHRMLQVPVHVTNDTNDDSRRSSSSPLPPVCRSFDPFSMRSTRLRTPPPPVQALLPC